MNEHLLLKSQKEKKSLSKEFETQLLQIGNIDFEYKLNNELNKQLPKPYHFTRFEMTSIMVHTMGMNYYSFFI